MSFLGIKHPWVPTVLKAICPSTTATYVLLHKAHLTLRIVTGQII